MSSRLRYAILAADLMWITAAWIIAHLLRYDLGRNVIATAAPRYFYLGSIGTTLIVWIFLYYTKNLEGFSRGWYLPAVCSQVIIASGYLMASMLALGYLAKIDYSRIAILILCFLIPVGLIAIRICSWWVVKSWSKLGATRRVIILGSGRVAKELANRIARHPELMIEVVGFLYPSERGLSVGADGRTAEHTSVGSLNVLDLLQQKGVKEMILAEQLPSGSEIEKLITSCHRAGMRVHLVPQWYELYLSRARLTEIDDVPMVTVVSRKISADSMLAKSVMDMVIGALLFIPVSLLVAVIAVPLHFKKKKAFKKELRCGLNGAEFWMYRFNVDRWAKDLVGFEKFLARFSLTELPQFWNVMRREMSLVGPRPESPDRVQHYSVWQRERLSVKPGLTGLAQVYGLREEHSSEEKAHFDLQYIYDWSMFSDLSIVLQTAWTLMFRLLEGKRPELVAASPPATPAKFATGTVRETLNVNRT
jgi:lipopolysaccharide/colanic/teichoic acid biosynthesis glycosyltransferase